MDIIRIEFSLGSVITNTTDRYGPISTVGGVGGVDGYSYSYDYKVTLFNELFSEESCSVIGLSEKMGLQL